MEWLLLYMRLLALGHGCGGVVQRSQLKHHFLGLGKAVAKRQARDAHVGWQRQRCARVRSTVQAVLPGRRVAIRLAGIPHWPPDRGTHAPQPPIHSLVYPVGQGRPAPIAWKRCSVFCSSAKRANMVKSAADMVNRGVASKRISDPVSVWSAATCSSTPSDRGFPDVPIARNSRPRMWSIRPVPMPPDIRAYVIWTETARRPALSVRPASVPVVRLQNGAVRWPSCRNALRRRSPARPWRSPVLPMFLRGHQAWGRAMRHRPHASMSWKDATDWSATAAYVRLLAASSTIRLFRLVTDSGNGLYPADRWKSCWNIRKCTRAGTTPCVNRLERITHRVDGGPL